MGSKRAGDPEFVRLLEALGGRLEVQSPVDRGTTVRAWLPEL